MSLIKDVRSDLAALNRQPSEVRKFGTTMAAAFGLFLGLGIWKEWSDGLLIGLASVSIFFGAGAYLFQRALIPIRIGWMGVAFCLGWIVSRVILIVKIAQVKRIGL
ncbi:MAG: hypothetical protein NTV54_00715 [Ignavibacteriales bacterium]|nr:hypothetical protein [Ignavibacteriales bacterium]